MVISVLILALGGSLFIIIWRRRRADPLRIHLSDDDIKMEIKIGRRAVKKPLETDEGSLHDD